LVSVICLKSLQLEWRTLSGLHKTRSQRLLNENGLVAKLCDDIISPSHISPGPTMWWLNTYLWYVITLSI